MYNRSIQFQTDEIIGVRHLKEKKKNTLRVLFAFFEIIGKKSSQASLKISNHYRYQKPEKLSA